MKKIFFWCPFIDHVGTVKSLRNSLYALNKYSSKNYSITLINVFGEWDDYLKYFEKINASIINLKITNKELIKKRRGFITSRYFYIKILVLSIYPLYKILKSEKPDYFIASLITIVPLIIFNVFNLTTQLIIRISGLPKLNFIRKFVWKKFFNKVTIVFCPTINTKKLLTEKLPKFKDKIILLRDPIVVLKELNDQKKTINKDEKKQSYIAIGRLTKQKNFGLLIETINILKTKYKKYLKLIIIGDGEEKNNLKKLITKFNLENQVELKNFTNDVFKYFLNSKCLICTSLWEDPGFVIIEAGLFNLPVISNACKSGPIEILDKSKNGYLFKFNSKEDLIKKIIEFENDSKKKIMDKKVRLKKYISLFSIFNFNKEFKKYF